MNYLPMGSVIRKAGPDMSIDQIHVARAETDWTHAYINAQNDFIAHRWFPVFPANQITGYVYKWRKDTYFRRWATRWQPGTPPAQARMAMDDKLFYNLDWRSVEYPIPNHLEGAADPAIDLDQATTMLVTNTLLIEREYEIASSFFKKGVWGMDWTGVEHDPSPDDHEFQQFDVDGSKPRDVFAMLKVALDRKAMLPNVCIMASPVFEKLRVHPQLLNWYGSFMQPGIAISQLTEDIVAKALGLDKIIVARAKYATSDEGVAVDDIVLDYIFNSRGIWLGHVDAPGLLSANSGMLISRNFDTGVPGGVDVAIERWPDQHTHVEYMQGFTCYQPVMVGKDLGLFMADAISEDAAMGEA